MKIQIEELDLLHPWPSLRLRNGYRAGRVLVRLGDVPIGAVTLRPRPGREISHRLLQSRIEKLHGAKIRAMIVREALAAGPYALESIRCDVLLSPTGIPSPLREHLIAAQRSAHWPVPAVTVALCTRDRHETVARRIQDLMELDYPNFEIIVVDSSLDPVPTREIAQQLGVGYVRCSVAGEGRSRNAAVAFASHDWVAFVDDDMTPEKTWLRELARPTQDPHCRAVHGPTAPARIENSAEAAFDKHLRPQRRTILLHKRFVQQTGGFDIDLHGGVEVLDVFHRVLRRGHSVHSAPRALAHDDRGWTAQSLRKYVLQRASSSSALRLRSRFRSTETKMRAPDYPISLRLLEFRGAVRGPIIYAVAKLKRLIKRAFAKRQATASGAFDSRIPATVRALAFKDFKLHVVQNPPRAA